MDLLTKNFDILKIFIQKTAIQKVLTFYKNIEQSLCDQRSRFFKDTAFFKGPHENLAWIFKEFFKDILTKNYKFLGWT